MNKYTNTSIFILIFVRISLSKMITDTKLKFSTYTNIFTSYSKNILHFVVT